MFSIGIVMFLIYPLLFGIRIVILSVIVLLDYILKGLSVVKHVCFLDEQTTPV